MSAPASSSPSKIFYACSLPPHSDYFTEALIFPGLNAREPYQMHGQFAFSCTVFSDGDVIGTTEPVSCDETGHVRFDLDGCLKGVAEPGHSFVQVTLDSTAAIPVAFYFAHIHRKTGLYYPSPAIMFMGDMIYQHIHSGQLENTLFWPGVHGGSNMKFLLTLVNPYEVPMSVEATAWHSSLGSHGLGLIRVSPKCCKWLDLDECIPQEWRDHPEPFSVGVAAQFKLVAGMVMMNRGTGIFSSADHLHTYQLH